ncbi:MAG: 2-amino-4-hydroxy-6-hydroxymethyldihydropteridine diphosphokinase [Candidatus Omnitrophica bacterium]|nr:2-amino-4-hydroxy-6-hydroxymethyldihydropteridine diphosphokinase [Candidatus Omnitrophota bacterium]MCM8824757.1 2-amino-4-hydroxy-6-hydroxymethyldihydropteridine diphosphokinase [Candidatus Omnitrophota bacterium]
MVEVIISFGSNLGNRRKNIIEAIERIKEKVEVQKVSKIYKSKPMEGVQGAWFLNGVLSGKTSLAPDALLKFLKSIEIALGRPANHKKNTARTIDLDILFYGNRIIRKKNLVVPHPRLIVRDFVLKGMMQINPDFIHPEKKVSVKQLWKELRYGNNSQKK